MSTQGRTSDKLVDEFVRYLNGAGFQPKFPDDIPEEFRTSEAQYGTLNWQIQRATSNPWIGKLTQQLPQSLPGPFRSLIERYRFCNFVVGPVMFFANSGHELFYELSTKIFKDKNLFPTLSQHAYAQFGMPHEGDYDPVCFAMQRRTRDDAPIVQLDHEEILIRNRIRVVQEIAPTFRAFMRRAIAEKFTVE